MNAGTGQFLRFCIVGCIGFIIDASIVYGCVTYFGMDPYLTRIVSYLTAATATWNLNRRFTFPQNPNRRLRREWSYYITANAIGGIANYITYVVCLWYFQDLGNGIIIGVAAGSAVGLAFNFSASKWWVFRH
jgi:putative flippase GtrA